MSLKWVITSNHSTGCRQTIAFQLGWLAEMLKIYELELKG